jgi:outer membrane lipoprotein SlyB
VAVTSAGTPSSSYDSTLKNLATFISDIASVTPQKNPAATTPFVAAVRPIAQIGAAMGGPAGESILGVVGAIAAAIAGAGVAGAGVAAKKNKTITTHEKAIQELASNVTDKTKLTPATQHIVAKIVAGA